MKKNIRLIIPILILMILGMVACFPNTELPLAETEEPDLKIPESREVSEHPLINISNKMQIIINRFIFPHSMQVNVNFNRKNLLVQGVLPVQKYRKNHMPVHGIRHNLIR